MIDLILIIIALSLGFCIGFTFFAFFNLSKKNDK